MKAWAWSIRQNRTLLFSSSNKFKKRITVREGRGARRRVILEHHYLKVWEEISIVCCHIFVQVSVVHGGAIMFGCIHSGAGVTGRRQGRGRGQRRSSRRSNVGQTVVARLTCNRGRGLRADLLVLLVFFVFFWVESKA